MKNTKQAACLLITNDTGEVLLVSRRNSTQVGLPGGKVDPGETPLNAALRETFEETGLQFSEDDVVEVFGALCEGEVNYFTTAYKAKYNGEITEMVEDDIYVRWGSINELINNSPFTAYNEAMIETLTTLNLL